MTSHRVGTLVEVFDDEQAAQGAVWELKAVGFTPLQIGVISLDKTRVVDELMAGPARRHDMDIVWGLPILGGMSPGVGPAIAGGILGVLFWSTATVGAAGAIVSVGVPYEEAEYCEDQFRGGRAIVVAKAGTRADIAFSVMNRFKGDDCISLVVT